MVIIIIVLTIVYFISFILGVIFMYILKRNLKRVKNNVNHIRPELKGKVDYQLRRIVTMDKSSFTLSEVISLLKEVRGDIDLVARDLEWSVDHALSPMANNNKSRW